MPTNLSALEPCTTNGTTRHQSANLLPATDSAWITGKVGRSLCGRRVYDELAAEQNFGVPIVLANLPACGKCEISARRRSRPATVARLGRPATGPAPRVNCPRCGRDCARRKDGTPQRHQGRKSMLICEEPSDAN